MNRVLYGVVQWWLNALPVNEPGRRAFDETLADWRKEAARASGPLGGVMVSAKAVFAACRCVAGVSVREAALIPQSGVLTRVMFWTAGYLVVVNIVLQFSPTIGSLSTESRLYSQVALVAFSFPIALLLGSAKGGRSSRVPSLGLGGVAVLAAVILLGWGVPLASREFLEANPGTVTTAAGQTRVIPYREGEGLAMAMAGWKTKPYAPSSSFFNDRTVKQLVTTIVQGPEAGWSALRWMSFFLSYVVACALIPVFSASLRNHSVVKRYTVLALTIVLVVTQGTLRSPFGEFSILWWLGAYWIPVIWMTLCLIAVTSRSHTRTASVH